MSACASASITPLGTSTSLLEMKNASALLLCSHSRYAYAVSQKQHVNPSGGIRDVVLQDTGMHVSP